MIYIADNQRCFKDEIKFLSKGNPFGCRIISLYNTYDYSLPFVDFWVQFMYNKAVSLIARLDSSFYLCLTDESDIDEISAFIRVSGADNVICDGRYHLDCAMKKSEGPVLYCDRAIESDEAFEVFVPEVKEVYNLLEKCKSDNFKVPSYESFMLDVCNKLNKGTSRLYAVRDEEISSCIMTLAESDSCAVLGALATDPQYRKKGYGRFLIKYITNILIGEGKTIFLHRAQSENINFYNKLGFKQYGIWNEYYE